MPAEMCKHPTAKATAMSPAGIWGAYRCTQCGAEMKPAPGGGWMVVVDPIVDPGAEFSKPKPHTLPWLVDFIRRHPGASTRTGEADLLVAEIDRLQAEVATLQESLARANRGRNME